MIATEFVEWSTSGMNYRQPDTKRRYKLPETKRN